MPFSIERTPIPEVLVVRPRLFPDDRGWFAEIAQAGAFESLGEGLPTRFVQVNQSRSTRGVVRGLHFQWDPPQGKLMRVVAGRALMVAVDIRPGSPTLGRHVAVEGSADEPLLFWAPASFARGFCVLSDHADVEYFCTAEYNPDAESGIRWDDPEIGIGWPVDDPVVSAKDAAAGSLADWLARPEAVVFRHRQAP
ncbi:MAG TPA: dTDP-4-dehydrorhamnose 3,5-epimerase [Candidatus Limnocylindrales bacterium]|nr:dTDP-4-dehydrorhamnose 3,5-epimerase [Candidatus Limnocylindrales bacterium]